MHVQDVPDGSPEFMHRLIPKTCEPVTVSILMLAVLSVFWFTDVALAADFTGHVVGVTDGDSIKVMHEGKAEKIRLSGIDCPEKKQPFGTRARQFTSQLVFGKEVTVQETGRDRYGRTLAEVILPDGRSLNQELVKVGLAWWFWKYSKDPSLKELEVEARRMNRGLWAEPNPTPPWEWRKHKKRAP